MPEVVILTAAALILIVDLFIGDERRHVTYWLTQVKATLRPTATIVVHRPPTDYPPTWVPLAAPSTEDVSNVPTPTLPVPALETEATAAAIAP